MSHAFSYAVKVLEWIDDNPVRKLEKPPEPDGRVRYLSDDERSRLLDACRKSRSALLYPFVLLALSTGMRHGEIANLYWDEPADPPTQGAWGVIHLDRRQIVLHQTKNKEKRVIPMTQGLVGVLDSFKRDAGLVFPAASDPTKPISLRTAFENAVKSAQIDNFRFHDLRHSCASYLAMSGATMAEIGAILGHKTLQMVKRYSHLSPDHVAGVLDRMTDKFDL